VSTPPDPEEEVREESPGAPDPETGEGTDNDPNTDSDAENHRYDEDGNVDPPEE
jgi:hypothetical protein